MQLSLNWLKDFIDLPKKITAEELAKRLSLHTVEVEKIEKQADKFKNIVIGKILEINKHPNADRLSLVKVDIKNERLDIVCGASNIRAGQLVPVALVGAALPNDMEIKETEVRGVKSRGMLCAEDELGLGEDHSGIMEIKDKAKVGMSLAEYLNFNDTIIEVDNKSLTNRPDLWSHYGLAREISAFLDIKLKEYETKTDVLRAESSNDQDQINLKIEDNKLCPRYMAAAMRGIKIEPSPKWMQNRLIAAGMRPVNNIVDATNYIMLELGQPVHAFDSEKVASAGIQSANAEQLAKLKLQISVRRAKKGESIETLDGVKRELAENAIIIAAEKKPIAIAGIMGGINSEIDANSKSILIESANFEAVAIRKTSQITGLRTESSMRFEKSLDPNLCEIALAGTVRLIEKICPSAEISGKPVDEKNFLLNQGPIKLDLKWLNKKIGEKIGTKKVVKILTALGFGVKEEKDFDHALFVFIPSWRAAKDVSIPEDLVEEAARIYGYEKIAPTMPLAPIEPPRANEEKSLEIKIKSILAGAPALTEVYNYSFVGEEQLKKMGINFASHIRLANPISIQHSLLRQSLVPGLAANVKTNQARFEYIDIFEIGDIYFSAPGAIKKDSESNETLPYQEKNLGIVSAGAEKEKIFKKIKGIAEFLFDSLGMETIFSPVAMAPDWADESYGAAINAVYGGKKYEVGTINRLREEIRENLNIKKEVFAAEINLKKFFRIYQAICPEFKKYRKAEKFPAVARDLAFVINDKILYIDIRDEILNFNGLVKGVEVFDVYAGDRIGANKKSLAFHIVYQSEDRTLISDEVDKIQQELIKLLEKKFEAKVRDF